MSRPVPASDEVIRHIEAMHAPDECLEDRVCPCGATVARVCSRCRCVLFITTETWCVHAERVYSTNGWRLW
jgi:hypothetical protein